MTLNEKLETISVLESLNISEEAIESIIETIEHPETKVGPFKNVEELMADLESPDNDEETAN